MELNELIGMLATPAITLIALKWGLTSTLNGLITRIKNAEDSATRAHRRLDDHMQQGHGI